MQTLRTELNDGHVMAVNVILGSSIISGQEVFSIIFPRDCSSAPAECEVSNGRQTVMQFFRVLVTNDDLLKLVSKSFNVQKVWILLQKMHSPATSDQTEFSAPDITPCDLIPQPGYSPNFRAQVVQINVRHLRPPPSILMDFTPTVGAGIVHCSNIAEKRSLGFHPPSVSKCHSFSSETNNHSSSLNTNDFSPLAEEKEMSSSTLKKTFSLKASSKGKTNNFNQSHYLNNQRTSCVRPTLESPINASKRIEPIVETPTVSSYVCENQFTPSKFLTTQLGKFTHSESCLEDAGCGGDNVAWYQIDHVICGFKDFYYK
ncbi:uncharacterized protein LOC121869213 [Homarus americanus]|uniref:uncharacterized protein LOC121869213 n=1 Tax=Homarus americanus TaxID=6706 RepID=UPI001C46F142|nr:uncharacterized protein LOC121869213 [Homarus americanus]